MDRKVVKVEDLQCLEDIANVAAFLVMEMDHYLNLAVAVDHYTQSPSADDFKNMNDTLTKCSDGFIKVHSARHHLITRLIQHGNLRISSDEQDDAELLQLEEVIEELQEMEKMPDNVIQFVPNKPVDKK